MFTKIIPYLDGVYANTIDRAATSEERAVVQQIQEKIVAAINPYIELRSDLKADVRIKFKKLRDISLQTIDECKSNVDLLIHWCVQRELLEFVDNFVLHGAAA